MTLITHVNLTTDRPMKLNAWFNARLLKSLRRELGWTQDDLAARSNLSTRVIAKAEASKGVAANTVELLVQTMQAAGKVVSCGDFLRDPSMIARKLLQNYAEHGAEFVARSREFISPKVDVYMDGEPITNPLAGNYHGIHEFDALFRKFFSIFVRDGGTLGDLSQMKFIDQEVFAWGHEYMRVPEAPPQLPCFVMLRMHFKGGLLVRFEDYYEASGMMARIEDWAKIYPDAAWIKHFDLGMMSKGIHWLPGNNHEKKYKPEISNIFNK